MSGMIRRAVKMTSPPRTVLLSQRQMDKMKKEVELQEWQRRLERKEVIKGRIRERALAFRNPVDKEIKGKRRSRRRKDKEEKEEKHV